ncbi:hypothetical protein EDC94DRAFT_528229, partial [Helicostylum pulchrum]
KTQKIIRNDTGYHFNMRITEACQNVLIIDLKGFCRYSESKSETCLNKDPL